MKRGPRCHGRMLGLLVAGMVLLAVALASEAAVAVGRGDIASVAKGNKQGKVIAVPRFQVPEQMLVPPRPEGSPTVTATITGKLVMRGCFTSAWSDGRKVKCPKPVLKACVAGRTIEVSARQSQTPRQFVTAGPDGGFTATVVFEDDFVTVHLLLGPIRTQSKGLRIICYPMGTFSVDISEARP